MTIQPTQPSDEAFVLPASFAQQRLWFLDRLEPDSAAYNVPLAMRLRGPLDVEALEQALRELVSRHESLRTTFALVDDVPHQVVTPPAPLVLPEVDLRDSPDAEQRALALVDEETARTFDLTEGPLLRAMLLTLSDEDHILTLTMHHAIVDAWSVGVLNRELGALYGAFTEGRPADLPEMPIQYGDYAVWQQEWMQSGGLDRQLEYWRQHLAGAPELLELPTDFPRPSHQSFRGAKATAFLPSSLLEQLKSLGEREGATLFMTLLAAFVSLLSRYTGEQDIVVASPVANRNRLELEGLIGVLANTLALRTSLDGDPTFLELLGRVRETALSGYSNQDLPFEKLVEELNPQRHLSHAPVAQVMFVLHGSVETPVTLPGLQREAVPAQRNNSKFDLALFTAETPDGLRTSLEYCTDLFEASTVDRMLEHFRVLLEGIVANPAQPVSRLSLLTPAEREQLLAWPVRTAAPYPRSALHELIAEQAARRPDAVALEYEDLQLSYAELDSRANQLAHELAGLGVEPGTLVGICADRSLELVVAMLGVLKSGATYVPIDPSYPPERQAFLLEDAKVPVLLTQSALLAGLPEHGATVLCLDGDWPRIAHNPVSAPEIAVDPEQLAYVIYTSGSTGRPKGVEITHRSVVNLVTHMRVSPGLDEDDVVANLTTFAFDLSVPDFYLPLCHGSRLVIVPRSETLDGSLLAARLERCGATFVQATPTTWQLLVDAGWQGHERLKIVCGGDALPRPLANELLGHGAELWHMYGPTETTVWSSVLSLQRGDGPPPIGGPIANTTFYVLDQRQQPAAIGIPGELYIGGAGLARGYRNRPELTAEKFVADPLADDPCQRLYRTGDRVRWRDDETLEFMGRIDLQVKLRGFRIELGEIEGVLCEHPGVREAVVVVQGNDPASQRLVGYLLSDQPAAPGATELRGFLARSLPGYMVPAAFVSLDAFPLTPNGKLDRVRLANQPLTGERDLEQEYTAPHTTEEAALAELWAALLKVERVGIHDNFFALGGHSLLATRLISRVNDALGVEIPLRAIFETPTVAGLAAAIEGDRGLPAASPRLPPLRRVPRSASGPGEREVMPASFAEQRLWFLNRLEPDSPAYNISLAVRLEGELDAIAMERALASLVARHESLRTTFELIDGVPHRVVGPPREVRLPVNDIAAAPDPDALARQLVYEEARRRFDLGAGPLLNAELLRLADNEHILMLTVHHIVVDGWSIGIFNRELSQLYGAFRAGHEPALPDLPIQYADYAVWQHEWMLGGGLDQQVDFWKQQLAGAPALLELPADHPRPAQQSFQGGVVTKLLPPATLEQLRALGEREGATLFMTLLAVFAALLSRHSGQDDIVVASPIANRNRVELEGLIGFFANTLALRVGLHDDPSTSELLRRTRETALGAFTHQDLPFEKLVEELNPERHLNFSPIAQVMFALNTEQTSLELPGLVRNAVSNSRRTAKFDLALFAAEGPEGLRLSIEYATDLFVPATAERMLEQLEVLLEAAIADPGRPVAELPLLTERERDRILVEWNDTRASYPLDRCIHELVAAQAARTPDAVAVISGEEQLSYAELEAKANRLAHHLRELGVGPDVVVAIAAERSIEEVVAVLAVLKAGGAYAPIDPAYPRDRVAFMLTDTATPVVLTQEHLLGRLPPSRRAQTVVLDSVWDQIAPAGEAPPTSGASAENLAYVIYTSGSTGRPKGVAMPHRPLANLLGWQLETWGSDAAARTLQFASLSFDVAFQEIFTTWCSGGALVLTDEETRRDAEALLAHLAEQQVERLFLPFVALQNLCEAANHLDAAVPSLRDVITAGEQLKVTEQVRRFFARHPNATLTNQYGPTESHVVTAAGLDGPPEQWPALPSIGRPIGNAEIYVLDPHRRPTPVGVPGELYIGGVSLAQGYRGQPELTSEKFVGNPFRDDPDARLYRTGDLARYLPDGNVEFLGRADHQVKIRGFRIEPGEIETVLRTHPFAREALVIARDDASGEKRLVAYVLSGERSPSASELREFLQRYLPDYMIPSAFVTLDEFPVTPNGKVDRQALPAPDDQARVTAEYAPPTTDLERGIAEIWQQLLGLDRVGLDDNFFDLGGHSLLAVRLFAEIERLHSVRLPLVAIFRTGTIRSLAAELRVGGAHVDQPTVLRLRPEGTGQPLFCIGGVHVYQELADALAPDIPTYAVFRPSEQELFALETTRAHHERLSVEMLAAEYLEMVKEQQPTGPYMLLGLCFGGIIAYEMAQQLLSAGEEVNLLAILDSVLPGGLKQGVWRSVRRRGWRVRRRLSEAVPDSINRLRGKTPMDETLRLSHARARIYGAAARGYEVRPYPGSALLVRPEATVAARGMHLADVNYGWSSYIRELDVYDAPGDHIGHLKRPAVNLLVDVLRPRIDNARSKNGRKRSFADAQAPRD